jgi:RHS repeat-associated protein
MPGRKFTSSVSKYRYGFNGKENDNETVGTGEGTQDYGMRIYNPALGKFLSVDPITDEYPELSPYQFANNTPIVAIDLDGLETALQKPDGTYTTPRDGRLQQAVPPQYFPQFENFGEPDHTPSFMLDVSRFLLEKPMSVFTGEDWDGNKLSTGDRIEAGFTVLGNLSGGKGGKGGGGKAPAYSPKVKSTNATQVKVNANAKSSTKAQTIYGLQKKGTAKIEKVGISSGKNDKNGTPYRANKQVNKLGKDKYEAVVLDKQPAGENARAKGLELEKQHTNANESTINPELHQRPAPKKP